MLAMIMGEAVRLGHAEANPLVSIKLRRDKAEKSRSLRTTRSSRYGPP